ncbi:hypothetical protein FS837_003882, partial [Tulasnella sp. UAMH 9824]
MLSRAIIPLALLFAGVAIANKVHEARDLTTEIVVAITDNGITRTTTISSVYTPTLGPDATPTGTEVNFPEDRISTTLPIDTSTACYCSIPVTTYTTQIQTVTIHGPTPTVLTVT